MLFHLYFFFITGLIIFLLLPEQDLKLLRVFTLCLMLGLFIIVLWFLIFFDFNYVGYQFITGFSFFFGNSLIFGVDGISFTFILLTVFVFPITLLSSWNILKYTKFYWFNLLLLEFFLILAFSSLDILSFFIFFEAVLIPMFFLVTLWGVRVRRIRAVFMLILYTLFGSVCLLIAIFLIYCELGTTSFFILFMTPLTLYKQKIFWILFFIGFSVKVPIFPFHIWLPEAHVEASTEGSMILASLLLKLGGYGFLRFFWECFYLINYQYFFIVVILTLFSIFYSSLIILVQMDLKKIIAYSSIAHMNISILALFTGNFLCLQGSFFLMIAHGIVSLALFFLIGVLYKRFKTRILNYYSGLIFIMPNFVFFLFIFSLANFAFPLTSNFIGEILIILGLFQKHFLIGFFVVLSSIFSGIYSLWFLNRICFGTLRIPLLYTKLVNLDLNLREFHCILPLIFFVILLGVYPQFIFNISFISLKAVLKSTLFF